jgi:hypothetical protein
VSYLAAWGKAIFFAENILVSAGVVFAGTWLRDLLVLAGAGHAGGSEMAWQLLWWSPLKALSTAGAGVLVFWICQRWLALRIAG